MRQNNWKFSSKDDRRSRVPAEPRPGTIQWQPERLPFDGLLRRALVSVRFYFVTLFVDEAA